MPEQEKKYFWLLENDGHNTPSWHKFSSQEHAEKWLLWINRGGPDEPIPQETEGFGSSDPMRVGYFSDPDNVGWEDPNGTLWTPFESNVLYTSDMTDWSPEDPESHYEKLRAKAGMQRGG